MAKFNADRELGYLLDMLDHYGRKRWLETILPAWEAAYLTAFGRVTQALDRRGSDGLFTALDVVGTLINAGALGVHLAFVPLTAGLRRLAAAEPTVPATPDKSAAEFMTARRLEFGRMLASCMDSIAQLRDRTRAGASIVTPEEFEKFRSRALLSPIWYPPAEPDSDALADRIELRMWRKAAEAMLKNPDYSRNLNGMAGRLAALKAVPCDHHAEWDRRLRAGRANPFAINRNIDYLHKQLEPWVAKDVGQAEPFAYPLPGQVKAYLRLAQRYQNPFFGLLRGVSESLQTPEHIMRQVPYVRLDWGSLPEIAAETA